MIGHAKVEVASANWNAALSTLAWTDVSGSVVGSVRVDRGNPILSTAQRASTASVTLVGSQHLPGGSGVAVGNRIRISAVALDTARTETALFTGYVESAQSVQAASGEQRVQLSCVDALAYIARQLITSATAWPAELGHLRAARILTAASWPSADQSVSTSTRTMLAHTPDGANARALLDTWSVTENAHYHVTPAGVMKLLDRTAVVSGATPSPVFGGTATGALPVHIQSIEHSTGEVVNRVFVTRDVDGATEQSAEDATSIASYGAREVSLPPTWSASDADSLALAQWIVQRRADPVIIPVGMVSVPRTPAELNTLADVDLADLVGVMHGTSTQAVFVRRISWHLGADGSVAAEFGVEPRETTAPPPAVVLGTPVAPTVTGISDTQATVAWPTVSQAVTYNIRYRKSSASTYTNVLGVTSPYTITGLDATTQYKVKIQAINGSLSSEGPETTFTTDSDLGQPVISGLGSTQTTITVTWLPVANATSYKLWWQIPTLLGTGSWKSKSDATSSPYTITGLDVDSTYGIRLEALKTGATSKYAYDTYKTKDYVQSAPTSVTATTIDYDSVRLDWTVTTTSDDASTYAIRYREVGTTTWTELTWTGSLSATTHTVNDLVEGTNYEFQVGTELGSLKVWSEHAFASTPTAITPGFDITVTPGDARFTVAYTYQPTADGARVEWSTDGGVTWSTDQSINGPGTSSPRTITGLTNGTLYRVRLRQWNGGWYSGDGYGAPQYSEVVEVTPIATATAPTIDSVDAGSTSAAIYFTPGANGSQTDLYVGTTKTASDISSPYTLSGLSENTSYTIKLRNVVSGGTDLDSDAHTFSTANHLEGPTDIVVTVPNEGGQLDITWIEHEAASTTAVYYRTGTSGSWTLDGSTASESYSIDGLTNGQAYQIRLCSKLTGYADQCTIASGTHTPLGAVGAATGLTLTPGDKQITVTWSAGTNAAQSHVEHRRSVDTEWMESVDGADDSPFIITGLINGTSYDVRILSVRSDGVEVASAFASSTPVGPSAITHYSVDVNRKTYYANSGALSEIDDGGAWTLTFWAHAQSTSGNPTLISFGDAYTIWAVDSEVSARFDSVANTSLGNVTINAWHHFAYVVTGAGSDTGSVYVDGVLAGEDMTVSGDEFSGLFSLGGEMISLSSPPSYPMDVKLDEIKLFSKAFTAAEVTADYASGNGVYATGTETDIEHLWHCDEGQGLTLNDTVGGVPLLAYTAGSQYVADEHVLPSAPIAIAPVTNLQASGSSSLTVTWTNSSGASSYNVEYKVASASTWTTVTDVDSPYTISSLTNGTTYDIRVTAVSGSSTAVVTIQATPTPPPPGQPGAPTISAIQDDGATVSWTSATGATSYNVQHRSGALAVWTTVASVTSPYTLTGLEAETLYNVRVQAVNSVGTTASTVTNFTTSAAAPDYWTLGTSELGVNTRLSP